MHIRPSRLLLSLFLCLWSLPLYADSGLEVDKSVSPEKQAKLDRADNGVPIVEIAPASKGGVSHNVFKEYNVGQEGIIYNNKADQDPGSSSFGSSVLARMPLLVNDRLSGKAARIILTEVSGSNLSHLRGMTEIYGSQAAYILANPNGIQVDGGGFINTNRVTLTTGASYFSTGGSLGGFRVQKGTVRILKGGLAGPPINLGSSPIEILSRAAVISGSVWNGSPEVSGDSSVSIYTGQNTFNYQDKQVTPASMPTGTPPKLAIDASLLGNIQAGKITFISTEEGVGVKAPRLLSHGGDITIQSQGPVSLPQAVESKESVSVQSAGLLSVSGKQLRGGLVHLSGSEVKIAPEALIYAEGNSGSSPSVLVEAASGVTNEGQIGSKQGSVQVQSSSLTNKGKIVSESGSVQLRVTDTLDNEGEIGSRASLLITAGTVKNSGALAGGTGNNKLEAKTLENSGTINSLHNWEIEADQVTNKPDGELSATGHLSVSGNTLSNEGKLVSAQGGLTLDLTDSITNKGTAASIGSQESLLITTKKVTNSGTITGGEIKNTLTADSLTNSGKINSLSGWSVIAKDVNNTGELIGKSDLSIASTDLSNEGKLLSAQGGVTLDVTDSIANEGSEASIGGKESLTITTKKVTNSGTITGGEGKNELKAETLTNSGTINSLAGWSIETEGLVKNTGELSSKSDLSIASTDLSNEGKLLSAQGSVTLDATASITNEGKEASIGGEKSLTITTKQVTNSGTITGGKGKNTLTADSLTNSGKINSLAGWSITTKGLVKNTGELSATGHLSVSANTLSNEGKLVSAQGGVNLDVASSITNEGKEASIGGKKSLTITTKQVTNSGTITGGEIKNTLTADSLTNSGKINSLAGWSITTKGLVKNTGELSSKSDLSIASTDLSNEGIAASIGVKESLTITTKKVTNSGALTGGKGDNKLEAVVLTNSGKVGSLGGWDITTDQLTNERGGELSAKSLLGIASGNLENVGKIVSESGSITLAVKETIDNASEGEIGSGESLSMTAKAVLNRGTMTGGKGENKLEANTIENSGRVNSLGDWELTTNKLTNEPDGELSATGSLLVVAKQLLNKGKLVSTKGSLTLDVTDSIANEEGASIGSKESLLITTKKVTNSGTITGGERNNELKADTLVNKGTINSLGDWDITADQVIHSGKELSSNGDLLLHFDTLNNEGEITGGEGLTELKGSGAFTNPHKKKIASKKDLSIDVGGQLLNKGTLAAKGNLTVITKQGKLINEGNITGGKGTTTLTAQGDIENSKRISSTQHLHLETGGTLLNKAKCQIAAGEDLKVSSELLKNSGELTGGSGTTDLDIKRSIDNHDWLTSAGTMIISTARTVSNFGMLSAGEDLTINANRVTNYRGKTIASGGNMQMSVVDRVENKAKGNIISGKAMTLEGPGKSRMARIESYMGHIESGEKMTLRAARLYNKSKVFMGCRVVGERKYKEMGNLAHSDWNLASTSGDSSVWYPSDRSGAGSTWYFSAINFYLIRENSIVPEVDLRRAVIESGGGLDLDISEEMENYGGVVHTTGVLKVQGGNFSNLTPSIKVELQNGYVYHKAWSWFGDQHRTFRKSKTFTVLPVSGAILEGDEDVKGKEEVASFRNVYSTDTEGTEIVYSQEREYNEKNRPAITPSTGHSIPTVEKIVHNPAASVSVDNPVINPAEHATIPKAGDTYGIFRLNITPVNQASPAPVGSHKVSVPLPSVRPSLSVDVADHPGVIHLPTPPARFLIETNIPFNADRFYGSSYFMRKTGLDKAENKHSIRFLGDPYYENRLINESILKATHNLFLNDDIATPEEQVKYLMDNAAEVHKDLKLTFGVALSAAQIKLLKKDIVWYVKQTVAGQEVLVPQLYLSQATVKGLSTPKGSVVRSRKGKVDIKSKGKVVNIGGEISGKTGVAIKAKEVLNEGVGGVAARIASSGGETNIQAEQDIKNFSGEISGKGVTLKSGKGDIISKTKVSKDGKKIGPQATIDSGEDLSIDGRDVALGGSKVKAKGNGHVKASRNLKVDTVKTVEETHESTDSPSGKTNKNWRKHTKEETQHSTDFDIGGTLTTEVAGDADFVGANVKANKVAMDVKGKTSIRAAYNKTDTKETNREETTENYWLSSERTTTETTHEYGQHKAVGNVWEVNELDVKSKGDVDLEKITVRGQDGAESRAKKVSIKSTEGDVYDHAAKETYYNKTDHTTETERKGLFWGASKQEKELEKEQNKNNPDYKEKGFLEETCQGGRMSFKLYERKKRHTKFGAKGHESEGSSFLVEDMEVASAQGKTTLEGSEVDASGTLKLSGKKGVAILDAIEQEKSTHRTDTESETLSVGIRNKFADIYLNAKDALDAKDTLVRANKAYSDYRTQCEQAREDLEAGKITQAGYDNIKSQDALHVAAIATATATVAAKTKQFTGSMVTALGNVATAGFSFDSEAEIERAMQSVTSQYTQSKKANIKAGNLIVESEEGDLAVRSSDIEVEHDLQLSVQNVVTSASAHKEIEDSDKSSHQTKARVEIPLSGVGASGSLNYTYGKGGGHQENTLHEHSSITVKGNTKLDVKGDMRLNRTQFHTAGEVEGDIGGDLVVETGLDEVDEYASDYTAGAGYGSSASGSNPSVDGGYSNSSQKGTKLKAVSAFTAGGKMQVRVKGKVHQKGAQVGSSENGQEGLKAEGGILKEDVYADLNHSNFGLNGRLGAKHRGGHKVEVDKESAYGKLDYGNGQLIQQATSEGAVRTVVNTGVDLSVDSEAVKAAAKPVETVTDITRDAKAVYGAGKGIVMTFAMNKKDENGERGLGTRGVIRGIQTACEGAAGLHSTSQDAEAVETLNNANEASLQDLHNVADKESKKVQSQDGIAPQEQSDLYFYQGTDKAFENDELKGYAAAHDKTKNATYLNTEGTDLSRGGDTMRSIHHEAERRNHRDSKFLKPLSDKQRDNLATLRGQQAESTWNLLTGANRQSRPNANKAWNARNKQALRKSNNFVAKHGEVDPREIDKIFGAANSLANNLSLGFIPRGKSDDPDYQQGQQIGDDMSSALSTALMISGGGMILQGGELVVSSPVLLALPGGGFVIAPGVAGVGAAEMTLGAGLAGYGSVVKQRVNNNNRLNFEGKGKGGGKNAAHANQKARQAAQKNYEEAKRKLEDFKKTSRGQKGSSKEIKRLQKQVNHWKKKTDFKGENHSNNAKGN